MGFGVGAVAVYRVVRASADMRTPRSRRALSLPQLAVQALGEQRDPQAEDRLLARGDLGRITALSAWPAQGHDRVGLPEGDHARTMARW